MTSRKRSGPKTASDSQPPEGAPPPEGTPPSSSSVADPDALLQVLYDQGIYTPDQIKEIFNSVQTLAGEVQNLRDEIQVLREKKKTAESLSDDVEDLKQISAKGRELQELRKVFSSSSPVELAIASRMLMPQDDGKAVQALQAKILALELAQVEDRHRNDLRDLSDRMSGEVGRLEQQVLNLQTGLASKTPRGSAVDELKGIVEAYKKLQTDLEGLGLTKKEGGNESLAMRALDRVGGKIMDVAEKYGLIDYVLTGGQSQQGTGRPPTPPTDREGKPYTQDEFNNSAIVWIRDAGLKLSKDQIMIDDKGFLLGYGDHIHRYIAQRNPQGVKPYVTPDDHYVVPNSLSEDYLVWARQNVPQQPAPPPPGPGASRERPNTGF